ncbi:hypothetical protein HAZT_HAZT008043, partial [Hyalella azteca]
VPRIAPGRARQSAPWPLVVRYSTIAGAGFGVFTDADLPCCLVFGPYQGSVATKTVDSSESGYGWQIRTSHDKNLCVDGADETLSNWMRFVNCPRSAAEVNLVAFQYHMQIYYRSVRPIQRGSELMVWYGDTYGRELGLPPMPQQHQQQQKQATTSAAEGFAHVGVVFRFG